MKKKLNKKTPNPKLSPSQQEMEADLDTYTALDLVAKSEGGKIIIAAAMKDVLAAIDALTSRYKNEPHSVLMAHCADLDAKLGILRTLLHAENQRDFVKNLLEESLKTEEE